MEFQRINPLTGEVASSARAMQQSDVNGIAESAQRGFEAWSAMGPNARRTVLLAAAENLQSKQADFVDAMMNEIGATAGWAMFNLGLAASMLREAASITTQISGEVIPSDKPGLLRWQFANLLVSSWESPLGTRRLYGCACRCSGACVWQCSHS